MGRRAFGRQIGTAGMLRLFRGDQPHSVESGVKQTFEREIAEPAEALPAAVVRRISLNR
jgi:hypothetical protein